MTRHHWTLGRIALALLTLLLVASVAHGAGVTFGPRGLTVLDDGYVVEEIKLKDANGFPEFFQYTTSLAFKGDTIIISEGGRYYYNEPYAPGLANGKLHAVTVDGTSGEVSTLATGLGDPVGVAVDDEGRVFFTHHERVSYLDAQGAIIDYTTGLPTQTADWVYLPVTDTELFAVIPFNGANDFNFTGTMGLAFAPDGSLYATQGLSGRPPDDPFVGNRTYEVPYSSSILDLEEGEVDASMVAARGCRNCYDLAIAPADTAHAGKVFATENTDVYRLRAQSGERRTALQGSTPTDVNLVDAIVMVDDGQVKRVASLAPNSVSMASVPTGIAFAPASFPSPTESRMFVTLFSGYPYMPGNTVEDRGMVVAVEPDPATGAGTVVPFITGLDTPIDVAFGPDGAMYVLEYYTGRLYRVTPTGS